MKRAEIRITGIVQGIGFRTYIYNLAKKHLVLGWVLNNEKEVFIDADIELEMIADYGKRELYPLHVQKEERSMVIDSTEIIRNVVKDLIKGISTSKISGKFHQTVARLIAETCEAIRYKEELNQVVLSGGAFQNIFLLSPVAEGLRRSGLEVFTHHPVPTNDDGISLGQAMICQMRLFQCA
jgi:hydrogenase maturation protein HypF